MFFSRRDKSGAWEVLAIDEAGGQVVWRHAVEDGLYVNPPAAANGRIVFTSTGNNQSMFWMLDQATGQVLGKAAFASPETQVYLAPTIAGAMAYTGAGPGDSVAQFSLLTGRLQWTRGLPRSGYWTPAVDGNNAYVFLNKTLYATSIAGGSPVFDIVDAEPTGSGSIPEAPVLGNGMAFVARSDRIVAFDLKARTPAWTRLTDSVAQPALADGVLYALVRNGSHLEAIDPATGALLWRSGALRNYTMGPFVRVVVSKNTAFATSWNATVAIDLVTRQALWVYPLGGELSVSDRGVLYILAPDGTLAAVNLR